MVRRSTPRIGWRTLRRKVRVAQQQAALGDPDAARYLASGHIVWPERMTGWYRASFIAALADGIDNLGDRVSGTARLWLSADRRRYQSLADELDEQPSEAPN